MTEKSKQLLAGMNVTFENLNKIMGGKDDFANIARSDLGLFLIYLSAVDGTISKEETVEIAEVINEPYLLPSEVKKLYEMLGLGSNAFLERIPPSLQMAVNVDIALPMLKKQFGSSCAEMLISTYVHVGIDLVCSDMNILQKEREAYNSYLNHMRQYVAEKMGQ